MENHLGRLLDPNEVVHHKNEIKQDNRFVIEKKLLKGKTPEVEEAISGNIVREFNSLDNPEETVSQQDP